MMTSQHIQFNPTKGMEKTTFGNLKVGDIYHDRWNGYYKKIDHRTTMFLTNKFTYDIPASKEVFIHKKQ